MKTSVLLGLAFLLSGCENGALLSTALAPEPEPEIRAAVDRLPAVPVLPGNPSANRAAVGIDVPQFHAVYEGCRARNAANESVVAMATARAAAKGGEGRNVVTLSDTPEARKADASFEKCMSAKGYRVARDVTR